MDELTLIAKRHQERKNKISNKKDDKKISRIFSKILLSIIFILISCIYIHLDQNNLGKYKKVIFEDNLTFAKINEVYHQFFGSLFPSVVNNDDALLANNEVNLNSMVEYLDGYKISVNKSSPISILTSGIIVYLDDKDGYGKTVIVQGIDGYDIWYSNITDINAKLYDYVEKGSIIGNSNDDYYYNVFYKDGNKVSYDEYFSQISN